MSLIFNNSNINLDEANGNLMGTIAPTTQGNNNDDESFSEYTDPDQSAPTELLAEFLTAIMKKDYHSALKYCKLILDYEPNNKTAKDFYPQLVAKINEYHTASNSDGTDENYNNSSSLEYVDNDVLDNEECLEDAMIDNLSESSSITSTSTSENASEDFMNSNSGDEIGHHEQEDLIQLSHSSSQSSNDSSKSDQLPPSMMSSTNSTASTSNRENTSHSLTSLLLEDDEINNNEPVAAPSHIQAPSSPFTTKIVQILKSKWKPN